jgi:Xaa-Pro aminopeptidase
MFKPQTYIQRRKELAEKTGSGLILFLGNDESPMNYADNGYHFRQDSTFLYYFGIDFPGLAALVNVDSGQEIILGNDYTIDDIVWMGPQPTIAERTAQCGVEKVLPFSELCRQQHCVAWKYTFCHLTEPNISCNYKRYWAYNPSSLQQNHQ